MAIDGVALSRRAATEIVIRKASVAEIEGNPAFRTLIDEYAAECAVVGLPYPAEKMALYRQIERTGCFQPFGAFFEGLLIGLIATITTVIPHYGVAVTVAESFFVAAEHRGTGAGNALLDAAEREARDRGSPGIFVSAPIGGQLAETLALRKAYAETNRVFFRRLADA